MASTIKLKRGSGAPSGGSLAAGNNSGGWDTVR